VLESMNWRCFSARLIFNSNHILLSTIALFLYYYYILLTRTNMSVALTYQYCDHCMLDTIFTIDLCRMGCMNVGKVLFGSIINRRLRYKGEKSICHIDDPFIYAIQKRCNTYRIHC
jgi:hypothetical protein